MSSKNPYCIEAVRAHPRRVLAVEFVVGCRRTLVRWPFAPCFYCRRSAATEVNCVGCADEGHAACWNDEKLALTPFRVAKRESRGEETGRGRVDQKSGMVQPVPVIRVREIGGSPEIRGDPT